MSATHIELTPELGEYLRQVSLREPDVLRRLREETLANPQARMQITPEQGQFMGLLVAMIGARRTLEVGVFTGYSSLSVALALPPDGQIVACDISEEWTGVARRYWREAGVDGKIRLRLRPAVETLDDLIADGEAGSFDFAFIDADKQNYDAYFERALILLRTGGVAAIDNVLWHGRPIDPSQTDEETEAIRRFNRKLHADERVSISMLPIGDGLTLARKR
jgi:caffeoyl-CoA O-methyltransferase